MFPYHIDLISQNLTTHPMLKICILIQTYSDAGHPQRLTYAQSKRTKLRSERYRAILRRMMLLYSNTHLVSDMYDTSE